MLDILMDMPLGKARGCSLYRNRQVLAGKKLKMRTINAKPQAWENRAKGVSGTGEYTKSRLPYNILTEVTINA